jgi:hypothetical protein
MSDRGHPWLRRMVGAGLLTGAVYAVWRAIEANRRDEALGWEPQPFPFPPQPRPAGAALSTDSAAERPKGAELASERELWMTPVDGTCPLSHPVKAKLGSGIYHLPGGLNYERTQPDRCYLDAPSAEADGLRPSKR